eukprot:12419617-Prorocentrum_lima.AAC.1
MEEAFQPHGRRAEHVVDAADHVQLRLPREEREQRDGLEHDAAGRPDIHLGAVVAVGEQHFGTAVPPRADVLGVRRPR